MSKIEDFDTLLADYINSTGQLQECQLFSTEINNDFDTSRKFRAEIQNLYNSAETPAASTDESYNDSTAHQYISQFLGCGSSKLLPPDMTLAFDLDINESIKKFKAITEEIKKDEIFNKALHQQDKEPKLTPLDLETFAASLERLCNQLGRIRALRYDSKSIERKDELEAKLLRLRQDMELFTKMVQSKTKLPHCNEEWKSIDLYKNLPYCDNLKCVLTSLSNVTFKLLEFKKMSDEESY